MNNFVSFLYVVIDLIKAFGPVIASGFLGWVAYNQFKLAKSQGNISQEQLALAKQQADIAQLKVRLDIRDTKREVFKRWNEIYYKIFFSASAGKLSDYANLLLLFLAVSDELEILFGHSKEFYQKRSDILNDFMNISTLKTKFSLKTVNEREIDRTELEDHHIEIKKITSKITQDHKKLMQLIFKELLLY